MKRILNSLLALAGFAALVTATPKQSADGVRDKRACSVATLKGNYAFTFNGFTENNGQNTPLAGAGLGMFDGAGKFSANYAVSFNGVTSTNNTYAATFEVHSDCTALMTSTNGGDNFYLVIIGLEGHEDDESTGPKREGIRASEILGVDISTGATWTIDLKKQ
ncbi:MAG: hypothetical protein JO033_02480 [Acidobacteriaceae bacterium]|nr:hypothetical protein [Acidobacteriota bacterium]MBV8807516.1 hypothetical protein [Acidobacteriaceae bacterium]MBV9499228.1 hypothetical protein [Acidobacteriaceae bacterium]